ncbi:hypothetical protein LTR94_029250 [Friedmanniomyces endolithicus]|nr:hypothetical protein LTR94_029250 [Friedmanniomyces endolithicus]
MRDDGTWGFCAAGSGTHAGGDCDAQPQTIGSSTFSSDTLFSFIEIPLGSPGGRDVPLSLGFVMSDCDPHVVHGRVRTFRLVSLPFEPDIVSAEVVAGQTRDRYRAKQGRSNGSDLQLVNDHTAASWLSKRWRLRPFMTAMRIFA